MLLVLTFGTTTWVGALLSAGYDPRLAAEGAPVSALIFRGFLTFSLPLMAILTSHEMGHYLMCRRYGIDASPPYFLPLPPVLGFTPGTLGAFIRIREPIRDKRELFDVGVAGPIAGFLVVVPLLLFGVTHARLFQPFDAPPGESQTYYFSYSLGVVFAQKALLGFTYTSRQVVEHPTFLAAWFGLFVTALNLLPLGQLDGGHALYAVFGKRQKAVAIPILLALALLGLKWPGWWLWVVITLVIGIRHPPVIDEAITLDGRRLAVAVLVLLIFLVCFAPVPLVML